MYNIKRLHGYKRDLEGIHKDYKRRYTEGNYKRNMHGICWNIKGIGREYTWDMGNRFVI